jgi:Ser/Thr protein kinase RdoA (MazF antagonist)
MNEKTDYTDLSPDLVLQALDARGFETSGRMLALNSYENRVYRVELEDARPLVAKFYRPGRWSNAAILEEHAFAQEIAAAEIPVVPPMIIDGETLLEHEASQYLLKNEFIPAYLQASYESLAADLLQQIEFCFNAAGHFKTQRIYGDCHRGNILWTDDGPHFVDLDDCCTGPAVQDLWMLLAGDRNEMTGQICDLLEGYNEFADFDLRELHLIEALRSLRMMYYASWLARRWDDAAFPQAFPWFNTTRYWEDHVLELREQLSRMREPVLAV